MTEVKPVLPEPFLRVFTVALTSPAVSVASLDSLPLCAASILTVIALLTVMIIISSVAIIIEFLRVAFDIAQRRHKGPAKALRSSRR